MAATMKSNLRFTSGTLPQHSQDSLLSFEKIRDFVKEEREQKTSNKTKGAKAYQK